jgi:hypothetical protein
MLHAAREGLVSNTGFRKKFSYTTEKESTFEEQTSKMSFNQQTPPTIILLKGDTSQGRGQLISNINACLAIQDTVRTTVFHSLNYFLILPAWTLRSR